MANSTSVDLTLQKGGIRNPILRSLEDQAAASPELFENRQDIRFSQPGALGEIRRCDPVAGSCRKTRRQAAQKPLEKPEVQFASGTPGEREKLLEDHVRGPRSMADNRAERVVVDLDEPGVLHDLGPAGTRSASEKRPLAEKASRPEKLSRSTLLLCRTEAHGAALDKIQFLTRRPLRVEDGPLGTILPEEPEEDLLVVHESGGQAPIFGRFLSASSMSPCGSSKSSSFLAK